MSERKQCVECEGSGWSKHSDGHGREWLGICPTCNQRGYIEPFAEADGGETMAEDEVIDWLRLLHGTLHRTAADGWVIARWGEEPLGIDEAYADHLSGLGLVEISGVGEVTLTPSGKRLLALLDANGKYVADERTVYYQK